jgi:hypothetical protein
MSDKPTFNERIIQLENTPELQKEMILEQEKTLKNNKISGADLSPLSNSKLVTEHDLLQGSTQSGDMISSKKILDEVNNLPNRTPTDIAIAKILEIQMTTLSTITITKNDVSEIKGKVQRNEANIRQL